MDKKYTRIRRATRTRCNIKKRRAIRLVIHRTPRHIYAQIISSNGKEVLVAASTVEKKIKEKINSFGNKEAANLVGKLIAMRALKKGIKEVALDRSGFQYHGRIKELAYSARKYGLQC